MRGGRNIQHDNMPFTTPQKNRKGVDRNLLIYWRFFTWRPGNPHGYLEWLAR